VSLLPDFCLPRRQHGPAILARFLEAFLQGFVLLEALRIVRKDAPSHSVAQSLREGFLKRASKIRAYLARVHPRAIEPPGHIPRKWQAMAALFFGLVEGFSSAESSFIFHGLSFHHRFKLGLA